MKHYLFVFLDNFAHCILLIFADGLKRSLIVFPVQNAHLFSSSFFPLKKILIIVQVLPKLKTHLHLFCFDFRVLEHLTVAGIYEVGCIYCYSYL